MILYTLECDRDHQFEAWFKSSEDFETQVKRGFVACPHCQSVQVGKALMAPAVSTSKQKSDPPTNPSAQDGGVPLAAPDPKMAELVDAMRRLKAQVTQNADYVGKDFAEEARKIHYGEVEERGIYGESTLQDAESLREEGIDVYPLPVLPDETN
ncbi:MAG: DUF1178 family protein [Pseudomonadota bacterium]